MQHTNPYVRLAKGNNMLDYLFHSKNMMKFFIILQLSYTVSFATEHAEKSSSPNQPFHKMIASVAICQADLDPLETNKLRDLLPKELIKKIDEYHVIPKTDANALHSRATHLYEICKMSYQLSSLHADLGTVLNEVFSQAAAKHNYLLKLICSLSIFEKKNPFRAFIKNYIAFKKGSDLISRHIPDLSLYRQTLDPYHSDHPEIHKLFHEWESLSMTKKVPPFLVWLEQYKRPDFPTNTVNSLKELELLKLNFEGGLIYQNNAILTVERADFVVDHKGNFYVSKNIKHTGFFIGAAVADAGEITVNKGKVTYINDNSGHYQPRIIHLLQAIKLLHKENVFEKEAIVSYLDTQKFIDLGLQKVNESPSLVLTSISVENFLKAPPYEPDGFIILYDYKEKKFDLKKL